MRPLSEDKEAPRPDPDALLERVRADEARERRGRLKIFFGASAGVGKTYAMLQAARRLRDQGVDVVAGIVETHGRGETQALLEGLERLPPRALARGAHTLYEFDLDAALARRPALVLVDELAHSNAPGTRHPKRWQDVEELLAAGIGVYSTINVQHLETLSDVVGGITGVRVWETVPDRVFDAADEVVLVDLTPDELLLRLAQGKVYLPRQAERAVRNFFRKGNLIALRELALRRTADRVDVDMLQYRRDRAVAPVWQTQPSLLACIGAGTDGDQVVRSAARMAARLDVPWHAVYAETPRSMRIAPARRQAILQLLKLAQGLGAETATVAGSDATEAVVRFAREHNIARVVVGRRRAARPLPWRRSFAERLAGRAPDLEVTTIAAARSAPARPHGRADEEREVPRWSRYAWSAAVCAATAVLASPLNSLFALPNIVMLFLLAVVLVAVRFGRGPAVLASFLSVAEFDFFFVPPRFSFAVSDVQYLLTFTIMLAVGLIAGQLTAGLKYQARVATHREHRVRAMYEMARDLTGALLPGQIAAICDRFVNAEFGARSCLMLNDDAGRVQAPVPVEGDTAAEPAHAPEPGIAQWALDHREAAGSGTNTLPASAILYLPLLAPMRARGVLAIAPAPALRNRSPEQDRLLDTVARLTAIALERVHYVTVAQETTLQVESERLRNSLLAAISHDLRTPLAGLVGLAESLRLIAPAPTAEQEDVIDRLREQSARLQALVDKLLDMARLQAGRIALQREWHALEELTATSLRPLRAALAPRTVRLHLADDLPLVHVDAALMDRVFCNLLENAAKFTPADALIDIGARVDGGRILLWFEDNGPGLPPGREEDIFRKFERGHRESPTPGVGLGLAICRAIVDAHGGSIRAENRPAGGARFLIELPLEAPPAGPPPEEGAITGATGARP